MNYLGNIKKKISIAIAAGIMIGFTIGITTGFLFAQKVQEHEQIAEIVEPVEEISVMDQLSSEAYTITGYCSCEKCCGDWAKNRPDGIVYGAYGDELQDGVSVAAPLPAGTEIFISGMGFYTVQDKTADWIAEKYDNKIIDVYFDDHQEALNFGVQNREIYILQ